MMKKKTTLAKRRTAAIIIAAALLAVLAIALALVLDFVNGEPIEDPADKKIYYVRQKGGVYALYDTDRKTVMPTEEQYKYYVTHAGTLVEVNAETGEAQIKAVVDTEGNEELGYNQRVLMFPHVEEKGILKIEVHNDSGDFAFVRVNDNGKVSPTGDFVIEGTPLTQYDQQMFAALRGFTGYTITVEKIVSPIKNKFGEFSEYGLVPAVREREVTDEDGNFVYDKETGDYVKELYNYEPAYYILTETSGKQHKVIIGDRMVTGEGYYVQYVDIDSEGKETKRDAVYVLSTSIASSLLVSVEEYVTPMLTYPLSMNNYYDLQNFMIFNKNHEATDIKDAYQMPTVGFSYIDLALRENTLKVTHPYEFLKGFELDGYTPNATSIDVCLQNIYQPEFVKVVKLAPTYKDFVKYGFFFETGKNTDGTPKYSMIPEHIVSFDFDVTDSNGKVVETISHKIYVTAVTEKGTRYVFTELTPTSEDTYNYNMIVEIEDHSLAFLDWDKYEWINASFVDLNVIFCDKITLKTPSGYWAEFDLDNSATDMSQGMSSANLVVNATNSNGDKRTTFAQLRVVDDRGNLWVISAESIKCYNAAGEEQTTSASYNATNLLGRQVKCLDGYIPAYNGSRVYVRENEIEVVTGEGSQKIVRYDTNLFRNFYRTLLTSTISDSYLMTKEDEAALIGNEDNLLLTMTVADTEGEVKEYKFYKLTSRKAYITINGNGGFYVLGDRVEKIVSDAQKFFANQPIDPDAKK